MWFFFTKALNYNKQFIIKMKPDKEVKKEFKAVASKNPEQYYAVSAYLVGFIF